MSTPSASTEPHRTHAQRWPRGTLAAVLGAAAALTAGAALVVRVLGLEPAVVLRAGVLALAGAALIVILAARHLLVPRFGAANAVTLTRGTLTLLLLALLGAAPTPALAWTLVGLAIAAVALDGVDGKLARTRSESSAFGARFDMETDALLILVLAALVWQQGKAGVWILLAGLLRYLFVAASYVWAWLDAALPPSRRRQTVCVLQIASLIGALAPFVVAPWSSVLALSGLIVLVWSFAVDVAWLARNRRT